MFERKMSLGRRTGRNPGVLSCWEMDLEAKFFRISLSSPKQ